LFLLPRPAFDQVDLRLTKLFSCLSLSGRLPEKGPPGRIVLVTINFSEVLVRSGTQLSFANYWFWVFRLALFEPFCWTEEQWSFSVVLEAACSESDAVSLGVLSFLILYVGDLAGVLPREGVFYFLYAVILPSDSSFLIH